MWDFERFADSSAVIDDCGKTYSYSALAADGSALAAAIGTRCLVFSLCRSEIGSVLGYTAFLNHRIVPVLLNAHLDHALLDKLLTQYRPSYLWAPAEQAGEFPRMDTVYAAHDYCLLKTNYETRYPLHGDLALLLTTSGSTGSPKFVRQSYENIRANTASIIEYLKLDSTERPITTLPMNYTYGLSIINTHLAVGATILLTEKTLMHKEFWSFFKEQGATSFGGVPYTYEMLDKLRFTRMELPSLRAMTQAGGKLTPDLHEKFAKYARETGKRFFVMYGQCEATARMGYLPPEKAVEKKGSMGIPIPGGRFCLIDGNGDEVTAPHSTGELVYEGANVTLGYAECGKDLAKGDERNGVLHTGDMAQFDEDGFYYIVGRKKRFLKLYGNRVNLDEAERLIKGEFGGIDCACGGIDDHMMIFVTDGALAEPVRDFAARKKVIHSAAFRSVVLKEIPKNDSGKTLYRDLEQYYG
ncbi:MAG: AMP-binding protein [Oscillospiraceae bacterium]|nr:AMP-binding protein [Oscillospiraceae bacterium]